MFSKRLDAVRGDAPVPQPRAPGDLAADLTTLDLEQLMELSTADGPADRPGASETLGDLPPDLTALSLNQLMRLRVRSPRSDDAREDDADDQERGVEPEGDDQPTPGHSVIEPEALTVRPTGAPSEDGEPPPHRMSGGGIGFDPLDLGALLDAEEDLLDLSLLGDPADDSSAAGMLPDVGPPGGASAAHHEVDIAPPDSATQAAVHVDPIGPALESEGDDEILGAKDVLDSPDDEIPGMHDDPADGGDGGTHSCAVGHHGHGDGGLPHAPCFDLATVVPDDAMEVNPDLAS